jgi:hypothetical protein
MRFNPILEGAWLGLNGLAAGLFVWLSSSQWAGQELRGAPKSVGGSPAVFTSMVMLWLVPVLLANTGWLVWRIRKPGRRDWSAVGTYVLLAAVWMIVVVFSASRL